MNRLRNPIRYLLLASMVLFSALASAELETIYYHNDHLGNPVAATNATGELMWQEEFTPYGTRQINQDGGLNQIWYTGKELDEDTGLVYFGARWYDPSIGQFLSVDPVGVIPGNRFSYNRYAYANNNPQKYIDPDGNLAFLAAIPWVVGTLSAFMTGYELGSTGYGLSTGDVSARDLAGDIGQEIAFNTALKAIPGGMAVVAAKKLGLDSFVGSATKGLAKIDSNKVSHIFGQSKHNLDGVVKTFGSPEKAFGALQDATQAAVKNQGIKGVFETAVKVGGETVTVRGNVVDGVVKLGTAFK